MSRDRADNLSQHATLVSVDNADRATASEATAAVAASLALTQASLDATDADVASLASDLSDLSAALVSAASDISANTALIVALSNLVDGLPDAWVASFTALVAWGTWYRPTFTEVNSSVDVEIFSIAGWTGSHTGAFGGSNVATSALRISTPGQYYVSIGYSASTTANVENVIFEMTYSGTVTTLTEYIYGRMLAKSDSGQSWRTVSYIVDVATEKLFIWGVSHANIGSDKTGRISIIRLT
jgi:hypothetical protein